MYSNTSSPRFTQFQSQLQSVFLKMSYLVGNVCLQKALPPYQKAQLLYPKALQTFQTIQQPNPKTHQDKNKGYIFFNVRYQTCQKGHPLCQKGYQPSQKEHQPSPITQLSLPDGNLKINLYYSTHTKIYFRAFFQFSIINY